MWRLILKEKLVLDHRTTQTHTEILKNRILFGIDSIFIHSFLDRIDRILRIIYLILPSARKKSAWVCVRLPALPVQ